MQAWQVEALTDPPSLRIREVPIPKIESGYYLVRVEATGLSFGDTLLIRGQYHIKPNLPFILGSELVGAIVEGEGGSLQIGTRIASSCHQGAAAEFALVPVTHAIAVPCNISSGEALALRGNFPTSLYALREVGRLQPGETVLVHAGAGGVGSAAVVLAKWLGARVLTTVGSNSKIDAIEEIGADEVINYSESNWVDKVKRLAPSGVDLVFDPVGGVVGEQSLRCLAYGARYMVIGFSGGMLTQLPANRLLLHNATAYGILWGEVRKRNPVLASKLIEDIFRAYSCQEFNVLPGLNYEFSDAPRALDELTNRITVGKSWLEVKNSYS